LIGGAGTDFDDPDRNRHLRAIYLSGVFQAGSTDPPHLIDIETESRLRIGLSIDDAEDRECVAVRIGMAR
jgi:hypothetical protein